MLIKSRFIALALFVVVAFVPAYLLDYTLLVPALSSVREGSFGLVSSLLLIIALIGRMWLPTLAALASLAFDPDLDRSSLGLRKVNISWMFLASFLIVVSYLVSLVVAPILSASLRVCGPLKDIIEDIGFPLWASITIFLVIGILVGVTFNALVALGEEMGWRGYLLERLSRDLGLGPASAAVGVVWGLWHAPLILAGYNYSLYGLSSCLEPAGGLKALGSFTLFTTVLGILLAVLRVKGGSTYISAAGHGTLNAVGGLFASLISGSTLITPPAGLSVSLSFSLVMIAVILLLRDLS